MHVYRPDQLLPLLQVSIQVNDLGGFWRKILVYELNYNIQLTTAQHVESDYTVFTTIVTVEL